MSSSASKKKKKVDESKQEDDDSWRQLGIIERHSFLLKPGCMHLSDCTFLVGASDDTNKAEKIHVHKLILSLNSCVFEAMFYGDLAEKGDIKIEDINPVPFRKMLQYIYTDNVDLESVEIALGVYYAAQKYLLTSLSSKCHEYIKQSLGPQDVCKTLEFSRLVNNKELEIFTMEKLKEETEKVLTADSFVDAEIATLQTLLQQNKLDVLSEVELFSACLRWAKPRVTRQSSLRETLDPILNLIRFRAMTSKEFAEIVCNTEVLTENEKFNILMCLASANGNMPLGLSKINDPRKSFGDREIIKLSLTPYNSVSGSIVTKFYQNPQLNYILLQGVQLKSRSVSDYEEDVKIDYCDNEGKVAASVTFKGKVTGNTDVKVHFNKPYPSLYGYPNTGFGYQNTGFSHQNTVFGGFSHQNTVFGGFSSHYGAAPLFGASEQTQPCITVTYSSTISIPNKTLCYQSSCPQYPTKFGFNLCVSGYTTISAFHLLKKQK